MSGHSTALGILAGPRPCSDLLGTPVHPQIVVDAPPSGSRMNQGMGKIIEALTPTRTTLAPRSPTQKPPEGSRTWRSSEERKLHKCRQHPDKPLRRGTTT